jgi:hypothetical protein
MVIRYRRALMMAIRGCYADAESEFRDIMAAQLELLGPDHPRTLWTRHELARMMAYQGNHVAAEEEYRAVLASRSRVTPDHPDILNTRHEIARMMALQGNRKGAHAEFQNVLAAKTRVLGSDHPSTKQTEREISSMNHSGDVDLA